MNAKPLGVQISRHILYKKTFKFVNRVIIIFVTLNTSAVAIAQISPDSTLSNPTVVTSGTTPGLDFVITGGTQVGNNLFHSFTNFSVPTGGAGIFNNASSIENIISRVTGGTVSNINGLIQTQGKANLFLINPNGIVFGPNAELNIGGSFIASTANSLKLSNGEEFSATNPTTPLLTISVPIGLQFGKNPGSIVNQSQFNGDGTVTNFFGEPAGLQGQSHTTLALVGGEIMGANGNITVPGGRIELGSVDDDSFVSLNPTSQGFALGYSSVGTFQNLQLQGSSIDVSGSGGGNIHIQGEAVTLLEHSSLTAKTDVDGTESGGGIAIRANQLSVSDSEIRTIASGSVSGGDVTLEAQKMTFTGFDTVVFTETEGAGRGGNMTLRSADIELTNLSILGTQTTGMEIGGNVIIDTNNLWVRDGAQVAVITTNSGLGGNLTVKASNSLTVVGESKLFNMLIPSLLFTDTTGSGKAGDIRIETGNLSVGDGARMSASTYSDGDAGNITIHAGKVELMGNQTATSISGVLSQVEPGASGQGGSIAIETGTLHMGSGFQVSVGTFGAGNAGSISVVAPTVEVRGEATDPHFSGLFAQVEAGATSQGGNITLKTEQLTLQGKQARISASTYDRGAGGSVEIDTKQLLIQDGAQIQAITNGLAPGGQIDITATNTVQLLGTSEDGQSLSGLFTSTYGEAPAGNLTVNTDNLLIQNGARISASTFAGNEGGNITINASDTVKLIGTSSNAQASSGLYVQATGAGKAGNINLTSRSLLLDQQAKILAETASDDGGEISLRVRDTIQMGRSSMISATVGTTSGQGNGGNININTGFLVAVSSENSDIKADALKGRGGNIKISAQSVFGTKFRIQQTALSDITASSTYGVSGEVEIKTPDVDPTQGLVDLPVQLADASNTIAQGCRANPGQAAGKFVVTGRGGLLPNPESPLNAEMSLQDLDTSPIPTEKSPSIRNAKEARSSTSSVTQESDSISEAQAIVINSKGEILLTAQAAQVTPQSPWLSSTDCKGQ
ncbi:filamentous hemagglutinin N-terminal domain-containing protein [Scytonema sp. UIC 10036]|uniref:two-partner secretion domain-containing protein n=1 Tax=Scytonema sp. UIC 10036 TaxID=2304196 RepID=UPI0012DA2C5D|nr:S-layer family protein [Scytonema sp. UIC 10036]MUG98825.1 filamentous hemagglutinin N-terminal domain-containing protein [Scytonema sp. UIC 10036]